MMNLHDAPASRRGVVVHCLVMKSAIRSMTLFASFLLVATLVTGCAARIAHKIATSGDKTEAASTPEQALRAANSQLYVAINLVLAGNPDMIDNVWSQKDDVTNFGPFGGRIAGWKAVDAQFKKEAAMKMGGTVVCEDLTVTVGADMGFTTCVEVGNHLNLNGKPEQVRFRSTNVFRLEKGEWKLVHHHTDPAPVMQAAAAPKG